jgi:murein DD-endopeptidase MepM/ murein hydrolase activator NlpD
MPPKETNKVSAGRAKVKATAAVASTASRASVVARATRSTSRSTIPVGKPVGSTTRGGPGAQERIKAPTFTFPVQGGKVTQQVGAPNKRRGYASNRNEGLDIGADIGAPITAGTGGTVIGIEKGSGAWGNRLVVDYGGGRQGAFNHLSNYGDFKVGQKVGADDVIGYVGDTGNTTGPHLDFETTLNGTSAPLASVFKGYQFDSAFGGSEVGVSDKGYNRSEDKFYNLDDLSGSSGGYTPSPSSSYTPTPSTTPSTSANSVGGTASNASTGFSGGQFVNLASLVAPGINRGMKKMSSPFKTFPSPSKSFSSKPFSSSSVGSTNSVGITPPTRNTKF